MLALDPTRSTKKGDVQLGQLYPYLGDDPGRPGVRGVAVDDCVAGGLVVDPEAQLGAAKPRGKMQEGPQHRQQLQLVNGAVGLKGWRKPLGPAILNVFPDRNGLRRGGAGDRPARR